MGRLFDAVAALCGIRPVVTYEGQAAIELEALANTAERVTYPGDAHAWIEAAAADAAAGAGAPAISARFHRAVADWTAAECAAAGTEHVVLSGGVFQNRLLLERTAAALRQRGLRVLIPERLPANDGGISYGQAAIAAALSGC